MHMNKVALNQNIYLYFRRYRDYCFLHTHVFRSVVPKSLASLIYLAPLE